MAVYLGGISCRIYFGISVCAVHAVVNFRSVGCFHSTDLTPLTLFRSSGANA